MQRYISTLLSLVCVFSSLAGAAQGGYDTSKNKVRYINTAFENASQANWNVDSTGKVTIDLIYDHERNSVNRANGHWHFQIEAAKGSEVPVELRNFDNIWNGMHGYPVTSKTNSLVSPDGVNWTVVPTEFTEQKTLRFNVKMVAEKMFVASVEPYRISNLDKLLKKIKGHRLVHIEQIGHTVEGRPLEMIRIGNLKNTSIVLRARAHPWEAGGNWVVEGLINSLLQPASAKYLQKYCIYVMPMANKDGVARGRTRFNMNGMDLNRQWDREPDSLLAPEKYAFEKWLKQVISRGNKPILAIDLHNDNYGNLHVNLPTEKNKTYSANLKRLEQLLAKHAWFKEGISHVKNPGSLGEGLAARYGIDACVYEFNYDWSEGLQKDPMAKDWMAIGSKLPLVFYEYVQ